MEKYTIITIYIYIKHIEDKVGKLQVCNMREFSRLPIMKI